MMGTASAVETHGGGRQARTRLPRAWLVCAFAASTVYAILVAVLSTNDLHRFWGTAAACGYGVATIVVLIWNSSRSADVAVLLALGGALLVPLAWMATMNHQQPEVLVVARSAQLLIHHGTPYEPDTTLSSTTDPNAFNPYLPLMAVFGLPEAVFGDHGVLTDPRIWFGLCFLIVFWLALRRGGARDAWWWTLLVAGSPVIALELAVGGTDVPMVAFLCLGFALLWQDRFLAAGLALGVGAAMKATAWPAVVIAFVFIVVVAGWRAALRFAGVALAVMAVCVGPFLVTHARSLVINTIMFPLGLAHVTSQAASPLLGHVVAQTGQVGHDIVVGLLMAVVLGVGVSLLVRPPRTVPSATVRVIVALTLLFVLAPSTRFGYFIYPASLLVWLLVCRAGRSVRRSAGRVTPSLPDGV